MLDGSVIRYLSYEVESCTCSWESELSRKFSLWDSLGLRGGSWYSAVWDEACPALHFLGLSFCLWAQEVKGWLVLQTEYVRISKKIYFSEISNA